MSEDDKEKLKKLNNMVYLLLLNMKNKIFIYR